jgi:hypothetical protein
MTTRRRTHRAAAIGELHVAGACRVAQPSQIVVAVREDTSEHAILRPRRLDGSRDRPARAGIGEPNGLATVGAG